MKKTIILLLPLILMAGCRNKESFSIKGIVDNADSKTLYLRKVDVNTLVMVDSSKTGSGGKFKFKVKATAPDFYQLGFSETSFLTLLAEPGEKIGMRINGANLSIDYTVTGSEGSGKVRMLDLRLARTKSRLDSLRTLYEAASAEPDFEEKGALLEQEFNNTVSDIRRKTIEFIIGNTTSLASLKALYQRIDDNAYVLYDPRDLQYMKIVSDSLGKYYPRSRNVIALAEDVKREMNEFNTRQLQNMANNSPEIRLDPELTDINGKRIALSSLRGKVVLLTFWSVDSPECIAENLQLKELYKIYKGRGFEIYQINLDEDEEKWKRQVRFDELPWISTREDDPSNPRNAILYNVRVLPANYLYGRDGSIEGTNLHGRTLQIKLNQLFNN